MSILIFILVIVALIVVHEFGHFVAAKWSGMRVDEFGLGYPPRALVIAKKGGTLYTLNWLPFGGFVKIYGEDGLSLNQVRDSRAFSARPRILQALVLVAGVAMNLLFAYVLITGALVAGTPRAL
ncbi:MAG: Peptidase M50, partial [Parcubacteria group bacterium GW2011_GWA1_54_9]